jgi:hypothetical protein
VVKSFARLNWFVSDQKLGVDIITVLAKNFEFAYTVAMKKCCFIATAHFIKIQLA